MIHEFRQSFFQFLQHKKHAEVIRNKASDENATNSDDANAAVNIPLPEIYSRLVDDKGSTED